MVETQKIIEFLMKNKDNPKVMSALTRSLGTYKVDAIKYLAQFTRGLNQWQEQAIYLTGGLFSLYRENGQNNIGDICCLLNQQRYNMEPVFDALLKSKDINVMGVYLKKIINQAKNKSIKINWNGLLLDLLGWHDVENLVQHKLAKSFYINKGEKENV